MSKFLLTNDRRMYSCAKEQLQNSRFKLGFDFSGEGIYALTTTKLLVDNVNSHQDGWNFILTNGTLLYDNCTGAEMHSKLLASYNASMKIERIRDNCYGIYAIGLYKDKRLTVWGDKSSIYDIFYYIGDGVWAISSSLSLLVHILKEKLSVNKLNLMEQLARNCILGGETVFNEIKRLEGHCVLQANSRELSIDDSHLMKFESFENDDEAFNEAAHTLQKIAKLFSLCYGKPAVSLTGGLDSRTILASYLSADVKPDIVYGFGNSRLIKSSNEDTGIVREYSRKFGLDMNILPLNDTLPIDKLWDELIADFEEDALFTRGNKDIIDYFARSPYPFFEIGKFGEFYRDAGWDILKKESECATVKDVAEKWYFKSLDGNIIHTYPGLRDHMLSKLGKCAHKYDVDPDRIERRDLQIFALEYYTLSCHVLNFVNRFRFCSCIIAESKLWSKFYDADRKDSSPILRLLNALYPAVLDIPIYSRWRYMCYDRKSMKLKLDLAKGKGLLLKLIPPGMMKTLKGIAGYQKMPQYISCIYANEKYKQILRKWLPEDAVDALLSANDNRASFLIKLIMWDKLFAYWNVQIK